MKGKLFLIFYGIVIFFLSWTALLSADESRALIAINRTYDVLPSAQSDAECRKALISAGNKMGTRSFYFAGNTISGARLQRLAATRQNEPLLRTVREELRLPVDLPDFILFLDDLLLAWEKEEISSVPYISPGRARSAGILLHPDDVYTNKPRVYAERSDILYIDRPQRQADLTPARNGDLLGPRWTVRYPNPSTEAQRMQVLAETSPDKTFVPRIQRLISQLREQGAYVSVTSTVRSRKRGYMMWGAFIIGRCTNERELKRAVSRLERLNRERGLNVPIRWSHPDGWQATIEAGRKMSETYNVVYATERGAFHSNHYDGIAIDMSVRGLPRTVTLVAPDGTKRVFDLSKPQESRDLSLTPAMVDWVEKHFKLKKLRSDYPHWDNAL